MYEDKIDLAEFLSMAVIFSGGGSGGSGGTNWTVASNSLLSPVVTLKKSNDTYHSLNKIEPKKWEVVNLTFDEIISLQNHEIKFMCLKEDDKIFIVFETEIDESQAIMMIGSVPYDQPL